MKEKIVSIEFWEGYNLVAPSFTIVDEMGEILDSVSIKDDSLRKTFIKTLFLAAEKHGDKILPHSSLRKAGIYVKN
jgi:hypothetical protein